MDTIMVCHLRIYMEIVLVLVVPVLYYMVVSFFYTLFVVVWDCYFVSFFVHLFIYTCMALSCMECTSVSMTHQIIAIHSLNKLICNKLTNVLLSLLVSNYLYSINTCPCRETIDKLLATL